MNTISDGNMELLCVIAVMFLFTVRQGNAVTNAALNKPVLMSSHYKQGTPSAVVDGNRTTTIHTRDTSNIHWVEVDLINSYSIHSVTITSRDCCAGRFHNFTIDLISDHLPSGPSTTKCVYHPGSLGRFETKELPCQLPTVARHVRVTMVTENYVVLDIGEIEVKARPVCGGSPIAFTLTEGLRRTDLAVSMTEVTSPTDCSAKCREEILCDAFQVMTISHSYALACQLFTGASGTNETDNSYKYYHLS